MATPNSLKTLQQAIKQLRDIDRTKLLRPNLGDESLAPAFEPVLDDLIAKTTFVNEYANGVHDSAVQGIASTIQQMAQQMQAQAACGSAPYISQRQGFIQNIEAQREQLLASWPAFTAAAIEARGFLQDEGIRREYQKAVEAMRSEAAETLEGVRQQAEKTIEEARVLAQQIEDRARRTATHISVEAAQEQFKEAQKKFDRQVALWGWFSALAIAAFVGFTVYLMTTRLPETWNWHVVYFTAVRIAALTAAGAVAGFCLRVLRAHMHMREHNLHRQRMANSMAAFVESAVTPEQRDLILSQLVMSVADFGSSGLLVGPDDSLTATRVAIEPRALIQAAGKT